MMKIDKDSGASYSDGFLTLFRKTVEMIFM
jgi:hypothetical protein